MIRPSLLRWSTAITLVGALALAGCSDGAKPATTSEIEAGPLGKILETVWGPPSQEDFNRKQDEIEKLVADCMAAEGFTYIPMVVHSTGSFTEEDAAEQNTKEWAAKNGYGMLGVEEVPEEPDPEAEPTQDWVDPNADYMNSLSEAEMAAFEAALYGTAWDVTEEEMMDEDFVYSWENNGCQGAAQHEVLDDNLYDDPRFTGLMASIEEVYSEARTAPEVLAAAAKWSDCMADAGYTGLTTIDDAWQSVNEAQSELYGWEDAEADPSGPSDEEIATFRELEIATAVADFDCREKVDWEAVNREVTIRLEEAFVKDNKVALDELVAAGQEARK